MGESKSSEGVAGLCSGKNMPVSLEQWRASVGAINASSSRALARLSAKPRSGGVLQFLLLLLVVCLYLGVWLVVKWSVAFRRTVEESKERSKTPGQLLRLIIKWICGEDFFSL